MFSKSTEQKHALTERKLAFQREKMEWEMGMKLLDSGSDIPTEERITLSNLLRKRLFARLSADDDRAGKKRARQEGLGSGEEDASVQALIELSQARGT